MKTFLLWFMEKVGEFISFMLSIHILGDLSLLHFVLGSMLLMLILKFIHLGVESGYENISRFSSRFSRIENKKDKDNYIPKHAKR